MGAHLCSHRWLFRCRLASRVSVELRGSQTDLQSFSRPFMAFHVLSVPTSTNAHSCFADPWDDPESTSTLRPQRSILYTIAVLESRIGGSAFEILLNTCCKAEEPDLAPLGCASGEAGLCPQAFQVPIVPRALRLYICRYRYVIHTYICVHAHIRIYIHIYTHAYMYTCIHRYTYMFLPTVIHIIHIHIYTHYTYMYVYTCLHIFS